MSRGPAKFRIIFKPHGSIVLGIQLCLLLPETPLNQPPLNSELHSYLWIAHAQYALLRTQATIQTCTTIVHIRMITVEARLHKAIKISGRVIDSLEGNLP